MADHHVSITVEGKTRFTSEGAEEVRRKAAEIGQAARGAIGDASNLDLGMQRAGKSTSQAFADDHRKSLWDAARSLADLNPSKALRESLEAVKTGNLEQARTLQRQVARYGAANPSGGHLEAAAGLSSVLRAAQTHAEVGGGATAERLQRFLKGYEGRFADLLAPLEEPNATGFNSNVYTNRARRMIHSAHAAIPGALRPNEISGLEGRLESAQRYLERARGEGANTDALKALTDELDKTKGTLGEHKEQLGRAQRVLGGPQQQGAGGVGRMGRMGRMLEGEMGGLARGMGGLTRILSFLPEALPLMAAGGAFFAAPAILGAVNKQARQQYIGYADLARQFGDRGEVFNQFRSDTGRTQGRFFNLGYSADEAAAAMSAYGQPLRGGGLNMDALQSILTLARGAGLTPDKVAGAAATLRRQGASTPASMDTLKNAMSAGLQEGIERSDTLTALLSITQQIYQNGKALTDAGLRQYAVIQQNLAGTGHAYFQRQAGATAVENVISGISNPQDPGLKALILTHMGDFTAKQLHLNPQQAAYYNRVQGETTMGAREFALTTVAQNPTGPVAQSAAKAIQETVTDPYFRLKVLESFGLSGTQALSMAAGGGLEAALKPGKLPEGTLDTQAHTKEGKEALQSRQINVNTNDMKVIASLISLKATGGLEVTLTQANMQVREAIIKLEQGDIKGATGAAAQAVDTTVRGVGLNPGPTAPTAAQREHAIPPPTRNLGFTLPFIGAHISLGKGAFNPPGFLHLSPLPGGLFEMPPALQALAEQETGNQPNGGYGTVNGIGAMGRFQIMPGTFKTLAQSKPFVENFGHVLTQEEFMGNPQIQREFTLLHFSTLYRKLKENEEKWGASLTPREEWEYLAAAHYGGDSLINKPPGAFKQALDVGPPEGVPGPSRRGFLEQVWGRIPESQRPPGKGFALGGYTGDLSPSQIAGLVHGSEFVVNAEATRTHRALLERINAGANQPGDTRRVEVVFGGGLPTLRVEGLPDPARRQVEALSQAYMQELARLVTAPQSYHGD